MSVYGYVKKNVAYLKKHHVRKIFENLGDPSGSKSSDLLTFGAKQWGVLIERDTQFGVKTQTIDKQWTELHAELLQTLDEDDERGMLNMCIFSFLINPYFMVM